LGKLNGRNGEVSGFGPCALLSAPTEPSDVEVPAFDLGKQGVFINFARISHGLLVAFDELLIRECQNNPIQILAS
jgi:hypothetical protein